MRKYKVLVPLLVLKGNNLAEFGSEVDESSLLSPAIDLVTSNHISIVSIEEESEEVEDDAEESEKESKEVEEPKALKETKIDLDVLDDMLKK